MLSIGRKKAFMSYLSTNYEIILCLYTSYQVLVVTSLTIKFWLLSEALDLITVLRIISRVDSYGAVNT